MVYWFFNVNVFFFKHFLLCIVAAPLSVSFGGREVSSYPRDSAGWSTQTDQHMMSSYDFNKLQQTNVQNYESLLHSDTNSKYPRRRSTAETKSTDLNHMIQHSLNKLSQVRDWS